LLKQYRKLTSRKQLSNAFLDAGRGSPAIGGVHDGPANYDVIGAVGEGFFHISGPFLVVGFSCFIVI
jgi:hypothetical protein